MDEAVVAVDDGSSLSFQAQHLVHSTTMSSVNSLTSIATIFFNTETDTHIRVFYQDGNGDIRESFYDHSVGWNTRTDNLVGTAAQKGTGISAVTWNNGGEV